MNTEETIKLLKDLQYSLVLDQEYELASNIRKVVKFLELKKFKE